MDFLEKVRDRKVDLAPGGDTALSPHTAEGKRKLIAKRIERMARDLGTDPLEVGEVKTDENFAAVIVRKIGGFDPSRLQVFPVALVKRGEQWEVAPLPASFENAGAGYAVALRKRLEDLENWMLRQQVVDLESLREEASTRMRARIETSLSAKTLRGYSAKQVGDEFLAACGRHDLAAVLGFFGGLATDLPGDWAQRLKAAERAMGAGERAVRPWRLLLAPEVVKVLVHHEDDSEGGLISFACLDPLPNYKGDPRVEILHFDLSRSTEGLWQVDPSEEFLESGKTDASDLSDEEVDHDLVQDFPAVWSKAHPLAPQTTSEQARDELVKALHGGGLADLLKVSALQGDGEVALSNCRQAASVWRMLHDSGMVRYALPLGFKEVDGVAAMTLQVFSAREPERLDLKTYFFKSTESGWLWTGLSSEGVPEALRTWIEEEAKRWPDEWSKKLLDPIPVVTTFEGLQAPEEATAKACVDQWLDAARRGNVQDATATMALLAGPKSTAKAFQNLDFEMTGSRSWAGNPESIFVKRGKLLTAVGVKIRQPEGKSTSPLYAVIQTPKGVRLLAETDLFVPENRGRDYLNNQVLDQLGKAGTDAMVAELRSMLAEYKEFQTKK